MSPERASVQSARLELTAAPLAPKTMETLNELRSSETKSHAPRSGGFRTPESIVMRRQDFRQLQGVLQDQMDVRTRCPE